MICDDYFFIAPDWQDDIKIGRRWQTNILTTIEKGEQRSTLRSYPVKTLSYSVVPFTASENNYVRRKLYRARDKIFGVPMWSERCETTMDVDSGTGTTFTVEDNSNRMYEVGCPIVFLEDENNYEVKEIVSIGSNQFTVDSSFTGEWSSGMDVFPILQGRMVTSFSTEPLTTWGHSAYSIEIVEDFDSAITRSVLSGSSFPTYCGLPVFNLEPNRASTFSNAIEVFPDVTQFLGKSLSYAEAKEGLITSKYSFLFGTREEAWELFKFFDEQQGRYGNFWYPSWHDDIVFTDTFTSTDVELYVEDIEWEEYWLPNDATGRFLYVLLPDGTEIFRRIKSATSTTIVVDSAMGVTITSIDRVLGSFLYMGRFNADEVQVAYSTEEVSSSELTLTTLCDVGISTTTT